MWRIAQLIDSLKIGGAQKLQVTFAAAARARGVPLTVLSLSDDRDSPLPAELIERAVCLVAFPGRGLFDPIRFWRLVDFMRRERYDVLQTHLTYANILGALAGRLTKTPVIATLHTAGRDPRHYHPLRYRLESWALCRAARVVAVGEAIAEAHSERIRAAALRVIPNAVPPAPPLSEAERRRVRAELVRDPLCPLLISVGRLAPPKGYGDLLAAFAVVQRDCPAAALLIAGDGDLREELAAQIAARRLQNHVFLLGNRTDVPRLLAAADLYVSASHWEGMPLAILEAMAAGLPAVATAVGEVPRLVVDGTGVLVPPRQPEALAAAVLSLLNDPQRRRAMGRAAAQVSQNYGPAAWFERYLDLYREVTTQKGGQPRMSAN